MPAPEVSVGGCYIFQALMIAVMIVVLDEAADVRFEIAGQIVVFKQDAVFERLMPTLDLTLGLGMIGRITDVIHAVVVEPFSKIARDVTRPIIASKPPFVDGMGRIAA